MLDSSKNVWLIEVNTNPCIEESSKLLKTLLPRMVDDLFKLTIDQVFTSESKSNSHSEAKLGSNLLSSVLKQKNQTIPA